MRLVPGSGGGAPASRPGTSPIPSGRNPEEFDRRGTAPPPPAPPAFESAASWRGVWAGRFLGYAGEGRAGLAEPSGGHAAFGFVNGGAGVGLT